MRPSRSTISTKPSTSRSLSPSSDPFQEAVTTFKTRIGALFAAGLLFFAPHAAAQTPHTRIGVCVYNASILKSIQDCSTEGVTLITAEDVRDQNEQIQQIEALFEQNIDTLIVNPIDRIAAIYLIRLASDRNLPIIIVNSEPLREDLLTYDAAYYVGSDPKATGALCGQIAAEHFLSTPEADKNGDGVIQAIVLKGQTGHQDAELRTKYSLKALRDAGLQVEVLSEEMALWERDQAKQKMAVCLAMFGDRVECVISNNDEMALGAIEALKAAGYFDDGRSIPVVGVDGISKSSIAAIENGTMLGTVLNDTSQQGVAAYRLAVLLSEGADISEASLGYTITDDHYVFIPTRIIRRTP